MHGNLLYFINSERINSVLHFPHTFILYVCTYEWLQRYSNCFIPHLAGKGYSWFSEIVLRGEKVGEFSFTLPDNLTQEGIKLLNFSLGVPEKYKYVVKLGNVSDIMIELTEPGECVCV